jgi:hypothetical protein
MDLRTMAEGMSFPGIDPREWCSYGLVEAGEESVVFDEDHGPLVVVRLQPSNVSVRCRVGCQTAGDGEGEFSPFVAGDEVLVALPSGDPKGGPVIVCRLNNAVDKAPMESVAGQDPTTNTFAYKRQRTAFIHEVAGQYLVREATSEAFFSIDRKGAITHRDGSKGALQQTSDMFGYQSGDGLAVLQLDLTSKRFTMAVGDATIVMSDSSSSPPTSAIRVGGVLQLSVSSQPAAEHVTTAEAVAGMFQALGVAMVAAGLSGPLLPLAAVFSPGGIAGILTAASQAPLAPPIAGAVFGAFAGAGQKPPAVPGQGQLLPGLGATGLLTG